MISINLGDDAAVDALCDMLENGASLKGKSLDIASYDGQVIATPHKFSDEEKEEE